MVSDLSIYTFIYNVLIDNRGLRSELSQFKRTKLLISGSWVRTPQRLPFFISKHIFILCYVVPTATRTTARLRWQEWRN